MSEGRFLPQFLLLVSGLIVWAGHFLLVYMFTGFVCARPEWSGLDVLGVGLVPFGIGVGTAVAVLLLFGLFRIGRRRGAGETAGFLRAVCLGGIGLALVAVIWEGLPAVTIGPCF
jgi:hypothetical protein